MSTYGCHHIISDVNLGEVFFSVRRRHKRQNSSCVCPAQERLNPSEVNLVYLISLPII